MEKKIGDRESPDTEWNRRLEKQEQRKLKRNRGILIIVGLFIVGCIIWSVYEEATKTTAQKEQEKQGRMALVRPWERNALLKYSLRDSAELTVKEFILSASPKVEVESGDLVVYIKTSEFKSISFPDQPKLIKALASQCCKSLSSAWAEIRIKDAGTGQKLDNQKCQLRNGSTNSN